MVRKIPEISDNFRNYQRNKIEYSLRAVVGLIVHNEIWIKCCMKLTTTETLCLLYPGNTLLFVE